MPTYIAIGMSHEDYWNGDPYLAVAYRRAELFKQDLENSNFWWQGVYFRQAMTSALSSSLPWFKRPVNYPKEPYRIAPMTKEEEAEQKQKEIEKAVRSLTAWKDAWDRQHG